MLVIDRQVTISILLFLFGQLNKTSQPNKGIFKLCELATNKPLVTVLLGKIPVPISLVYRGV
jgi:hypothetical protein